MASWCTENLDFVYEEKKVVVGSETHEAAVVAMRELVFVAGSGTREAVVDATCELVAESQTHEAVVGATHELVVVAPLFHFDSFVLPLHH